MAKYNVNKIVFSSSACVYGDPEKLPITESSKLSTTNPYGTTKLMIESILKDVAYAKKDLCSVILRYFNPIGAHPSGLIGENPNGIPNNLAPYIAQVAKGKREFLSVFGDDYKTPDGTGVRDYIHVVDLALGHIAALESIKTTGTHIYNLGTGKGTSVLELLRAFEKAYKKTIPYKICARREGDIDACYADCQKAKKELGWTAKFGIDSMCQSICNFESKL
ncbi:udp-glucose 4-epimerase [Holotrichia oblita]|nr:udp-glucose 4-epimerase [Holotrichia oblita]